MKFAIISDIHDNVTNLNKCLNFLKSVGTDELICCGDLTNADTLKALAENFRNKIHLIRGNIEIYDEAETRAYKNVKLYGRTGIFRAGKLNVGICHEPAFISRLIDSSTVENQPEIIFYGHTHKPWIEDRKGIKLVNPGTLGGVFQRATFSLWDTKDKSLELKILDELPASDN